MKKHGYRTGKAGDSMHTSSLLHNIGRKNRPFDRSLTINYWITKSATFIKSHFLNFQLNAFKYIKRKLLDSIAFRLDDMTAVLNEIYQNSEGIHPKEAEEVYPDIQKIRKEITKQKNKFASIDFAGSKRVRSKFYKLVRLSNRLEARLHNRMHSETKIENAPAYMKDKFKGNSRKAINNALR